MLSKLSAISELNTNTSINKDRYYIIQKQSTKKKRLGAAKLERRNRSWKIQRDCGQEQRLIYNTTKIY